MRMAAVLSLALLATAVPPAARAQQTPRRVGAPAVRPQRGLRVPPADTAAARLRRLFFLHDYEGVLLAGRELERAGRATPEARAWAVGARAYSGLREEALAAADSLARRYPGSPWPDFARALARSTRSDSAAVAAAIRARAGRRWHPDLVWVHALALTRAGNRKGTQALADSVTARSGPDARLLLALGAANERVDEAGLARARQLYDQALRLDSTLVGAWLSQAALAFAPGGSPPEGLAAARRARELAPLSLDAHHAFWTQVNAQRDWSREQKQQEIAADVAGLLQARSHTAAALAAAAGAYRMVGLAARADSVEAELRRDHAGSYPLEQLDVDRILLLARSRPPRAAADSAAAAARAELRARARRFVAEPGHRRESLGLAYNVLVEDLARDSATPPAELAAAVEGLVRAGEPNIQFELRPVILRLAEHPESRAAAARIAREIPRLNEAALAHVRFGGPGAGEEAQRNGRKGWLRRGDMMLHDALGWIALQEGQLDSASAELARARAIVPDAVLSYHTGVLAERQGRLEEAEKAFLQGYEWERGRDEHPNEQALLRLGAQPGRPADWFQQKVGALREKERARSKAGALSERLKEPKPAPAFKLARLEGGTLSSDELKGKVVVVNFWGVWCGPCVKELPQIQQLYDRYRDDPDVVIVTIDNDPDPQQVREFLKARKLDLPVLIADGAITRTIDGWPTTWFLDREGRITYHMGGARSGSDEDVLDEFVWRLESLR